MKNRILWIGLLASAVGFGPSAGAGRGPAGGPQLDFTEMERFLKNAEVMTVTKDRVPGRNDPWVVMLNDGESTRSCVFKYIDRPRPYSLRSSYKYEIAAYELDKLLGFNRVPPVVGREIEGLQGSLQVYLEDCINESDRRLRRLIPPDQKAFDNALDEINVFENLTACERTQLADIMIHTRDWRVCRVDFAEAFAASPRLLKGQEIVRSSRKLYDGLRKLGDAAVKTALGPFLEEAETAALIERKRAILETLDKLIKEKGEASVLF